jgi:hypothetical protein
MTVKPTPSIEQQIIRIPVASIGAEMTSIDGIALGVFLTALAVFIFLFAKRFRTHTKRLAPFKRLLATLRRRK